jgi:hypothetical protein
LKQRTQSQSNHEKRFLASIINPLQQRIPRRLSGGGIGVVDQACQREHFSVAVVDVAGDGLDAFQLMQGAIVIAPNKNSTYTSSPVNS